MEAVSTDAAPASTEGESRRGAPFWPWVLAILCCALASVPRLLRPSHALSIESRSLDLGVTTARLTWRSGAAYPSLVEVRDEKGTCWRITGSCDRQGFHQVTMRGLKAGQSYHYVICQPGGERSLPRPLRLRPLRFTIRRARGQGPSTMVDWETSHTAKAKLTVFLAGGRREDLPQEAAFDTDHRSSIPWREALVEGLLARCQLVTGEELLIDLAQRLGERARRASRRLRFDPIQVISTHMARELSQGMASISASDDLVRLSRDKLRRNRMYAVKEGIVRSLRDMGAWRAHEELRSLLPFLLEGALLPGAEQDRLRRALYDTVLVQLFLAYYSQSLPETLQPRLGRYTPRPLRVSPTGRLQSLPVPGTLVLESRHALSRHPHRHVWTVERPAMAKGRRLALVLFCERLSGAIILAFSLNDSAPVLIYSTGGDTIARIWQVGLPPSALTEGTNELAVEVRMLPGIAGGRAVRIRGLCLLLEP